MSAKTVQSGSIVDVRSTEKNLYLVRLIESGTIITAGVVQYTRGVAVRFVPGDYVIVTSAANAWFVLGLLPGFADGENTAPRQSGVAPGDVFLGNADTGAGMHVTGGTVSMEAAGVDGDGDASRSAGTFWVSDYDAINNLCRRFGIDASAGKFQMLHDDETGQAAARLWIKPNAKPDENSRTTRIQMGYHKDPVDAVFSLFTFPGGKEPESVVPEFNFKIDPENESEPFAGQWPKTERGDWQSRYFVLADGTTTFEIADIKKPSMVDTVAADINGKVVISPDGRINVTSKAGVTLDAVSRTISLSEDYSAIVDGQYSAECEDVSLGARAKAIPVANKNFFTYFVNSFFTWAASHTHSCPAGTSSPPVAPAPQPPTEANGLTQDVILS